ncbi:PAS domain-containing protein [Telmatocola sphagniphila]|uniref:histidine kinase n=2 Tax=Telmatocola sphagniphila TaxID=1123043 RepID=A0A8E6EVF1_9BACT|nr:PAS domain-containing protein [Telmatocola sphagniphila]
MRNFAKSIVETVPNPLVILNEQFEVVEANSKFVDMLELDHQSVKGLSIFTLAGHTWDCPKLRGLLENVVPKGEMFSNFELDWISPSSPNIRVLSLSGRKVLDNSGNPMILISIQDNTLRRQMQNDLIRLNSELESKVAERTAQLETSNLELLQSNRELASANSELEAFCYSVSHDLRSPLRAIDGFSQELIIRYAERLDPDGRHFLNRVRANTQRMGQLIDDLLKLSKVTRLELRKEIVDLTSLANSICKELVEQAPKRSIEFEVQPGLQAYCDAHLMRIALQNLLDNAFKFSSKKAVSKVALDQIKKNGTATFVVRDNGSGFDMTYASKLFGAFQRLHSDQEFTGTGIGLATVKRIIHRHGGTIWAESVVGEGASFYFTLS